MSWKISYKEGKLSFENDEKKLTRNQELDKAIKTGKGASRLYFFNWFMVFILIVLFVLLVPIETLKQLSTGYKLFFGFFILGLCIMLSTMWILMNQEDNTTILLKFLKERK